MNPSMGPMTASGHAQAAPAAMPPLHRSNTDGPRRHILPKKASFKSKGSILSHVTSGTWEEDADIENPHDAEEARKSPRVRSAAKSAHLPSTLCRLLSRPSVTGMGEASKMGLRPGTRAVSKTSAPVHAKPLQPCRMLSDSQADKASSLLNATSICAGAVAWSPAVVLSDHWRGIWWAPLAAQLCPHLVPDL